MSARVLSMPWRIAAAPFAAILLVGILLWLPIAKFAHYAKIVWFEWRMETESFLRFMRTGIAP